MKRLIKVLAVAAGLIAGLAAHAEEFPSRTITWIVPFGPGQTSDIISRIVAERLGRALKQSVVVDNRPGANGRMASEFVAKAKPDGYTLMWGSAATHGMNSALYSSLPYDPVEDFVPVAYFGATPIIISTSPKFPASNITELVKLLKEKPGFYTIATSNPGAAAMVEEFQRVTGTKLLRIPYKVNTTAFTDVIGGRVTLAADSIGTVPYIKNGQLKAIGVSTSGRSPLLPNVPTLAESGLAGFDISPWGILFAPKGTPEPIVRRLNAEVMTIMADPKIQEAMRSSGYNVGGAKSPAELRTFVKTEHTRWVQLIQGSGIKLD